jgi:hypothetical protein
MAEFRLAMARQNVAMALALHSGFTERFRQEQANRVLTAVRSRGTAGNGTPTLTAKRFGGWNRNVDIGSQTRYRLIYIGW